MRSRYKQQNGYTVIELVVAVAMFAILLPATASIINTLSSINGRAQNSVLIHSLVENKIETLRSSGFAGAAAGTVDFTGELPSTAAVPRSASYNIALVNPTLKQVDVTITFSDYGVSRSLSYRTYLGDDGIGQ